MKLYVNIYPKVIGGLNIIGNIPGIFLEKNWKYHGIFVSSEMWEPLDYYQITTITTTVTTTDYYHIVTITITVITTDYNHITMTVTTNITMTVTTTDYYHITMIITMTVSTMDYYHIIMTLLL